MARTAFLRLTAAIWRFIAIPAAPGFGFFIRFAPSRREITPFAAARKHAGAFFIRRFAPSRREITPFAAAWKHAGAFSSANRLGPESTL